MKRMPQERKWPRRHDTDNLDEEQNKKEGAVDTKAKKELFQSEMRMGIEEEEIEDCEGKGQ